MSQEYYAHSPFLIYNVLNLQIPDIRIWAAFGDGSGYSYFIKKKKSPLPIVFYYLNTFNCDPQGP